MKQASIRIPNHLVGTAADPAIRIAFLDYLRIFAFLSVLIGHVLYHPMEALAHDVSLHASLRAIVALLLPFVRLGGAGVVVFFLVSGYIIARVLQSESPSTFAVKRFFRIYPLYIAALVAELAFRLMMGGSFDAGRSFMQLTLLGDLTDTPYALGGVEWTLRIEIFFYLLMGGTSWLSKRIGTTMNRSAPFIFVLVTLALAFSPPLTDGTLTWGSWPATGVISLYFPFLLIGSMLFLFEQRVVPSWVLIGFIGLVLAHFFWRTPLYQPLWKDDHHAVIALGIFIGAWLWRNHLPSTPLVRWLSDLTYSVYLFHNWFYFILLQELMVRFGWSEPVSVTVSLVFLFGSCYLASVMVEKPLVKFGRRVARRIG